MARGAGGLQHIDVPSSVKIPSSEPVPHKQKLTKSLSALRSVLFPIWCIPYAILVEIFLWYCTNDQGKPHLKADVRSVPLLLAMSRHSGVPSRITLPNSGSVPLHDSPHGLSDEPTDLYAAGSVPTPSTHAETPRPREEVRFGATPCKMLFGLHVGLPPRHHGVRPHTTSSFLRRPGAEYPLLTMECVRLYLGHSGKRGFSADVEELLIRADASASVLPSYTTGEGEGNGFWCILTAHQSIDRGAPSTHFGVIIDWIRMVLGPAISWRLAGRLHFAEQCQEIGRPASAPALRGISAHTVTNCTDRVENGLTELYAMN
ncbi:hypothetical protein B0H17DRAFT_1141063 [Mycena rosella]|uniref:Uncharacterized protein n=1 Tax=Mycena rosella TaxID=1033263 RepID=A0AAD7D0S5_MYCRO|nr:hypothetical protein B0H17DRAFT_1141063 [Mycena rosella]